APVRAVPTATAAASRLAFAGPVAPPAGAGGGALVAGRVGLARRPRPAPVRPVAGRRRARPSAGRLPPLPTRSARCAPAPVRPAANPCTTAPPPRRRDDGRARRRR